MYLPYTCAGYAPDHEDQQRFNNQVAAMNPAVTITAPVRITQAADDERVYANLARHLLRLAPGGDRTLRAAGGRWSSTSAVGLRIIKTLIRVPRTNAYGER